jgi:hypothetical protein
VVVAGQVALVVASVDDVGALWILSLSRDSPNERGFCHYAIERLNEEIRRRERVIRIFPNRESVLRLVGALLMEQDEAWITGKRYFDMTACWQWHAAQDRRGKASQVGEAASMSHRVD